MLLVRNTTSMEAVGMIVSSSLQVDKADSLVKLAENLVGFVRQSVKEGASLDHLERGALQQALGIGQAAVDMFLEAQGDGDLGDSVITAEDAVLHRSDTIMTRPVRTIFGVHSFQAYVYTRGSKRKIELRPIDARLNLPEGKASYLLQEFSQLFCVEKAFGVGARQFETVFGQKLSVDVLEEINRDMGRQAEQFLDVLPKPPVKEEGEILVTTSDGKGVPLVKEDAGQVPAFDEKERPGNRRMATLGGVYTVNRHVRTPEQVLAALFRDPTVSQPEHRPEPQGKHFRGYFAEPSEPGEEAVPSAYRTWSWIAEEVTGRWQAGQVIIRLMDGQQVLWDAAEACLVDFIEDKRQAGKQVVQVDILDIMHASTYVWKVAKAFHSHKEYQEAFAQDRLLRILQGEVRGVITGMRRMASQRNLTGEALKDVTKACNYLENNAQRMRYDEYLKAGYPIASGVIEGACRHVIKDRMEQGGMRWTLAGAEAMLNVRSVCASSEWETFGIWRQAEEAKRVHPHRAIVKNYQGFKA
jgi:hypothetical protein